MHKYSNTWVITEVKVHIKWIVPGLIAEMGLIQAWCSYYCGGRLFLWLSGMPLFLWGTAFLQHHICNNMGFFGGCQKYLAPFFTGLKQKYYFFDNYTYRHWFTYKHIKIQVFKGSKKGSIEDTWSVVNRWFHYISFLNIFMFLAIPGSTWGLSSPTRDWTCTPCIWSTKS